MDGVWIVVGVVGGLIVGGVVAWAVARSQGAVLQAKLSETLDRLTRQETEQKQSAEQLASAQTELTSTKLEVAKLETTLAEREQAVKDRLDAYEKAEAVMTDAFGALATKALNESKAEMQKDVKAIFDGYKQALDGEDEQRRTRIERLLEPVKDSLQKLDEEAKRLEQERNTSFGALIGKISELDQNQLRLSSETTRLVRALQDSGQAGQWGEFVLQRVFELANMTENVDFVLQETNEDGLRPDAVVKMPGGRELVVDSKSPMKSYLEAQEVQQPDQARLLLIDHANKLYDHARVLSKRDYTKKAATVDFNVMFVSSESAYRAAVEFRPSLIEDCMAINVVIATPTTLLALLRAVSYGWQQEKLAEEAKNVREEASKLYKALATLTEHYERLGTSLDRAVEHFNSFGGSLQQSVLPAARKFEKSGVPVAKVVVEPKAIESRSRKIHAPELLVGQPSLEVLTDP